MAEAAPTRPLTYDDLAAMPDDGKRYELIFGEIYELPGPTTKHQSVSGRLFTRLNAFVNERRLGRVYYAPLDVYFSVHHTVQPDIVYVSRARRSIIRSRQIEGVPNLIIEVISPSNRAHDVVRKAALYATYAVPEYWLVDPEEETITPQQLILGLYVPIHSIDGIARSVALFGFEVDPREIFSEPKWMTDDE